MRPSPPNWFRLGLFFGLCGLSFAGDLAVTATGTIQSDQYGTGPYAAAQVGDEVRVRFEVVVPGQEVIPGHHQRYAVDLATFEITIAQVAQPGALVAPAFFDVRDDLFQVDSLRFSHVLDHGELLELELTADDHLLRTPNLEWLVGYHSATQPQFPHQLRISGSDGWLSVELDQIVVGREVTFSTFCDPLANSTGQACTLSGSWLPLVGAQAHLEATQGPPGAFGYFLISSAIDANGVLLSDGRLCLQGQAPYPVGRFNVDSQ